MEGWKRSFSIVTLFVNLALQERFCHAYGWCWSEVINVTDCVPSEWRVLKHNLTWSYLGLSLQPFKSGTDNIAYTRWSTEVKLNGCDAFPIAYKAFGGNLASLLLTPEVSPFVWLFQSVSSFHCPAKLTEHAVLFHIACVFVGIPLKALALKKNQ